MMIITAIVQDTLSTQSLETAGRDQQDGDHHDDDD